MKTPAILVLFMYFVAFAVFESIAGMKEDKGFIKVQGPRELSLSIHRSNILQYDRLFPAFEKPAILKDDS